MSHYPCSPPTSQFKSSWGRMLKQAAVKIVPVLMVFVVSCFMMGCRITRAVHPLSTPDTEEFLPNLIGTYEWKGEHLKPGLVVLRKSKSKPHAYELIDATVTKRDGVRLVKLGNWTFVEFYDGDYYCIWRYTIDDGVITLFSADDAKETDSRTADFRNSLEIKGSISSQADMLKDLGSITSTGIAEGVENSFSRFAQPSTPAPFEPDAHSTADDSDMFQYTGPPLKMEPIAHSTLLTRDLQKAFRKYGDTFNKVYGELRIIK